MMLQRIILLCALVGFFVVSIPASDYISLLPGTLKSFADELFFGAVGGLILIHALWNRRINLPPSLGWFVAFSLLIALLSVNTDNRLSTMAMGIFLLVKPFLVFLAGEMMAVTPDQAQKLGRFVERVMIIMVVSLFLMVLLLDVALPVNPIPGPRFTKRFGFEPARGPFFHPFIMAVFSLFAFMYFLVLYRMTRRQKYLGLLVMLLLIVFLASRVRLLFFMVLSVGFVLLVLEYYLGRRSVVVQRLVAQGLLALPVLLIGFFLIQEQIAIYADPDRAVRTRLIFTAIDINKNTGGLGAGPGNFGSVASIKEYSTIYHEYGFSSMPGARGANTSHLTDQWWAWYLGETGVLGFGLFIAFIIAYIRDIGRGIPAAGRYMPHLVALQVAVMGMLSYGLLVGAVETFFHNATMGYATMLLAAFCRMISRQLVRIG